MNNAFLFLRGKKSTGFVSKHITNCTHNGFPISQWNQRTCLRYIHFAIQYNVFLNQEVKVV